MSAVLVDRLVTELGYPRLDESNIDHFLKGHEHGVLFFTEDPQAFPESNDVAVILPELVRYFGDRLAPAVIAREAERALKKRYGFRAWPALVFLRRDRYLGVITRVQGWEDYLEQIERILAAPPSRPPVDVDIAVVADRASGGGCPASN